MAWTPVSTSLVGGVGRSASVPSPSPKCAGTSAVVDLSEMRIAIDQMGRNRLRALTSQGVSGRPAPSRSGG